MHLANTSAKARGQAPPAPEPSPPILYVNTELPIDLPGVAPLSNGVPPIAPFRPASMSIAYTITPGMGNWHRPGDIAGHGQIGAHDGFPKGRMTPQEQRQNTRRNEPGTYDAGAPRVGDIPPQLRGVFGTVPW